MRASELATRLGGVLRGEDREVSGFATDHRQVRPGDAFLAIRGSRVDGHDFAPDALRSGAAVAVTERPVTEPEIVVPDLVAALARLAGGYRDAFTGPVVGITGSAGKTTTKELTAAALAPLGRVAKTEGNRNTEYTAPLLWTEVGPGVSAVVVEMAMRGFGQIAHLASFSRPTVGIVTNIGWSHIEAVGDRAGIARAKGELLAALPPDGVAIAWAEDEFLPALTSPAPRRLFGFSEAADARVTRYEAAGDRARVEGTLDGAPWSATLPAAGRHIALDAAAALLAATAAGVPLEAASAALSACVLPPLRSVRREREGVVWWVDAYNAAPNSVVAALETMAESPVPGRRLAALSQMNELGSAAEEGHRLVGRALRDHGIEEIVVTGDAARWIAEEARAAGVGVTVAPGIEGVRAWLAETPRPGDAVLVKGSRSFGLERALPEGLV